MLETTVTINSMVIATILALVAGLIRNVAGFLENALRDGVITTYEWKQLAGTVVAYIGTINVLAIGLDPETAVVVALVLDLVRTTLKSLQ